MKCTTRRRDTWQEQKRATISPCRSSGRLPRYYRFLYDLKESGVTRISSQELSLRMGLTASQIRQDLNCFGGFGQQGYGYAVEPLYNEIGHILGMDHPVGAVLLGVGNLGKAIANHMDFAQRGFRLVGLFDDDPALCGSTLAGQPIRPTASLESFCREHKPQMAILCIPKEAAPQLVERLTPGHITVSGIFHTTISCTITHRPRWKMCTWATA